MTSVTTADREITFEHEFAAPRALVFKAWTEPERLANWFGPAGWTLPVCEVDPKPGGVWRYCMRGPKGEESWGRAVYREIVEPERLAYTDYFTDAQGNVNNKMPSMEVTVSFEDLGGKTRVTMRSVAASAEQVKQLLGMGMEQGMKETWQRLEAYLASA